MASDSSQRLIFCYVGDTGSQTLSLLVYAALEVQMVHSSVSYPPSLILSYLGTFRHVPQHPVHFTQFTARLRTKNKTRLWSYNKPT